MQRALQHKRGTHELILVEPKSKQSRRTVHLVDGNIAVLRAHRRRQLFERQQLGAACQDRGSVFTMPDGAPLHPRWVGDTFRRLLPKIGLLRVRVHDLRHTAATLLLESAVYPKVVREMLGHSTVAVTLDLYSHLTPTLHVRRCGTYRPFSPADCRQRVVKRGMSRIEDTKRPSPNLARRPLSWRQHAKCWGRECVGVEPTRDDAGRPADGFEDREHHRAPSTPLALPIVSIGGPVWQIRLVHSGDPGCPTDCTDSNQAKEGGLGDRRPPSRAAAPRHRSALARTDHCSACLTCGGREP